MREEAKVKNIDSAESCVGGQNQNSPNETAESCVGAQNQNPPSESAESCVGAQNQNPPSESAESCVGAQNQNPPSESAESCAGSQNQNSPNETAESCAGSQNQNSPSETIALVQVTFQKNTNQELKYLEAEPKALGITQIMMSLFLISTSITNLTDPIFYVHHVLLSSLSSVGIIAGSVAIAAKSLHLPKLKACLGMEIGACAASVFCFILASGYLFDKFNLYRCVGFAYVDASTMHHELCEKLLSVNKHLRGLEMLVIAAQFAISATLAAFCCKVIRCCSPTDNVPMIVVNAPLAPQ